MSDTGKPISGLGQVPPAPAEPHGERTERVREAQVEIHAEIEAAMRQWRGRVRACTYAGVLCVISAPALLAALFPPTGILIAAIPGGSTAVAGIIALGGSVLAAPIAEWIARMAVRLPDPPPDRPGEARARDERGRFRPDDPETSMNEAYDDGVGGALAQVRTRDSRGSRQSMARAREAMQKEALDEVLHHSPVGAALRRYALGCAVFAKGGPTAAAMVGIAGGVMSTCSLIPWGGLAFWAAGPGAGCLALAVVLRKPLPIWLRAPRLLGDAPGEGDDREIIEAESARPTGSSLLDKLCASPLYRGQDAVRREIPGAPMAIGRSKVLLQSRYPRLKDEILEQLGIDELTKAQGEALAAIFSRNDDPRARDRRDFVLVGWPGSGRSTLCNLITLGAMLHREGSVQCVAANSPNRDVAETPGIPSPALQRHPSRQLRSWLVGMLGAY
ncbi:MAG: hypothetical protein QGG40_16560, partial [Myxococcota bacterium]|nr:hypothetical protein [Myxococcota bacterium]